jgi:hypothetical protein
MLSRGWGIVTFSLTRQEASNLTWIVACTYLCYSSLFMSQNFKDTQWLMKIVMAGMYIILAIKIIRSIGTTLSFKFILRSSLLEKILF